MQKELLLSVFIWNTFFHFAFKELLSIYTRYFYISFYERYSRLTNMCETSLFPPVHECRCTPSCVLVCWFCRFLMHPKRDWQIPFTLHNIHSPVIVYDPKYLSQQLWMPLHTATTTFGIMMFDLGAIVMEASTFWGDYTNSSNNLRSFLLWAMMIDRIFPPVITFLGVL